MTSNPVGAYEGWRFAEAITAAVVWQMGDVLGEWVDGTEWMTIHQFVRYQFGLTIMTPLIRNYMGGFEFEEDLNEPSYTPSLFRILMQSYREQGLSPSVIDGAMYGLYSDSHSDAGRKLVASSFGISSENLDEWGRWVSYGSSKADADRIRVSWMIGVLG